MAKIIIIMLALVLSYSAIRAENDTVTMYKLRSVNHYGELVYISEELMRKLEKEEETWHWTPWLRTRTKVEDNVVQEMTCASRDSINSFPASIFTDEQLRQGAFLCFLMLGIYGFTLLTVVCNDYFIPCVEMICEDLKIPQNVAAATFMSVATSCPEFFTNVISTFLTESDMGIGTIIGSAIFNALGVAAIGGLAARSPIKIEWRAVTRDVIIYMVNVGALVIIVWDGQVNWYEAMTLLIMYILYFVIMFNSVRIFRLTEVLAGKCCQRNSLDILDGDEKQLEGGVENKGYDESKSDRQTIKADSSKEKENDGTARPEGIFTYPKNKSVLLKIWWWYTLPIRTVLGFTIPSPMTCRKMYPLAFFMCIVWIGLNSYIISWSMTVIGYVFLIPDSIMGMTFLAFGGCLPEACSIFIMSRRGEGGMGVSNALGANSLAILFALGIPWLIRTLTLWAQGAEVTVVFISSAGIGFVVGTLLVAVICLWFVLLTGKFRLRKSIGFVLMILYVAFITFAVLVELGIILDRTSLGFCV